MQGFQKVVGHQEIITHLQNAISMNKVSHAYLFGGESGSGKKMMASLFAMTLQCEKHGVEPCMECPSCKKAQSQNHPDIIYVKHEKPPAADSTNVVQVEVPQTAPATVATESLVMHWLTLIGSPFLSSMFA